jgi:serine/threonine protein kinase
MMVMSLLMMVMLLLVMVMLLLVMSFLLIVVVNNDRVFDVTIFDGDIVTVGDCNLVFTSNPLMLFQVDVWSLGIVAIEMAQGYPPLGDVESYERLLVLSKSGYNAMDEEVASQASDDFKDFLYNGALLYTPLYRSSVQDLLNHPFMSYGDNCACLPLVVGWARQEQMLQDPD